PSERISCSLRRGRRSGVRETLGQSPFTIDDVKAIREECLSVAYVTSSIVSRGQAVSTDGNWSTMVRGVDPDFPLVRAWNVASGRFSSGDGGRVGACVCVLGAT